MAADQRMGADPILIFTLLSVAAETVLLTLPPDIIRQIRKQARGTVTRTAKAALADIEQANPMRPN